MAVIDTRGGRVKEVDPDIRARSSVPTYQSNENLKLGRVPQINATAFAAPGRALERAGAAISGAADRLGALSDKQNNFKDALNFTNLQNNLNMEYLNHTQTSSEDGVDFAKGWQQKQQQLTDEFLGGVSPKNKDRYKVNVAGVTGRHSLRAAEDEYNTRNQYQTKKLAGHVLTQSQILLKSPTPEALEDAVQSKDMLIDSMSISRSRKEALKRQNGLMLRSKYIEGLEKKDPIAAKAELQKLRSEIGETFKASEKEAKNSKVNSAKLPNNAVGQALGAAAQRHGVNPDVIASIAKIESNFDPSVQAGGHRWPKGRKRPSSARGLGQFINSTARQYGLKNDGSDSIQAQSDALARFTKDNITVLKRNLKRDPTPGEVYLAHFAGVGRAQAIGRANDNTPISKVLSQKAIAANRSILQGKTVGQVKAWAARKMGGTVSTKVSEAAYVPPKIDNMLNGIEKRIDKAVVERQELVVKDALKGKPALVQQQMIDQLAEKSRTEPGNKQLEQQLEFAKKAKKKFDTAIKNDPLDVGESHGIAEVKPLIQEGKAPVETLNERRVAANKIAEVYQIKPRFLRPDEAVQFKQRFDMLETSDQLAQLAAFEHGFKGDATKVISEFSKQDVGFAHVGGLFLKGRRDVAARALIGMKAMNDKANKIMVENLNKVDTRTAITNVFGNLFPNLDKGLHKGFLVAGQALAFEALMTGKETDPQTALENGLRAASGEKIVDGGLFGFDEQWGGIAEFNGQKFLVPTDMKADDIEDAFEFITSNAKGSKEIFLRNSDLLPTNPETREPVTGEELEGATFVSVEQGKYKIVLDSGHTLKNSKPSHVDSKGLEFYSAYILDINDAAKTISDLSKKNEANNSRLIFRGID